VNTPSGHAYVRHYIVMNTSLPMTVNSNGQCRYRTYRTLITVRPSLSSSCITRERGVSGTAATVAVTVRAVRGSKHDVFVSPSTGAIATSRARKRRVDRTPSRSAAKARCQRDALRWLAYECRRPRILFPGLHLLAGAESFTRAPWQSLPSPLYITSANVRTKEDPHLDRRCCSGG
jgi:hypothetical protein